MKELDHKAIGLRIRKQRILLKLSREELAQKIGVSTTFLTDIELGTKGFSLKSLNRFSQVLKMSAETILYGSEGAGKKTNLLDVLAQCPKEKINYAEEIIRLFLVSHQHEQ
ncbi:helix-turn-helix domain-containing protein [Eubacterium sp.]|uniref:helix-turn-helix domain-containing protein n=1 Tax=Eubacterium sp. TaxID=142586 RepID=UPI0026E092FB|nr:helix-turn-helix transcriptional regulator [Eubacterium sp.]MDO5434431.1 helix-turn-helix transcriptional regulator [Eubacterium sp.]